MKCKKCEELITDIIEGNSGSKDRKEFFKHIEDCKECGQIYNTIIYAREEIKAEFEENEFSYCDNTMEVMRNIDSDRYINKKANLLRRLKANKKVIASMVAILTLCIISGNIILRDIKLRSLKPADKSVVDTNKQIGDETKKACNESLKNFMEKLINVDTIITEDEVYDKLTEGINFDMDDSVKLKEGETGVEGSNHIPPIYDKVKPYVTEKYFQQLIANRFIYCYLAYSARNQAFLTVKDIQLDFKEISNDPFGVERIIGTYTVSIEVKMENGEKNFIQEKGKAYFKKVNGNIVVDFTNIPNHEFIKP